jgi:hypothetical protein
MISTSCGVWMSPAVTGPSPSLRRTSVTQVEHDVDDVFLHAVDGRILVQHAGNGHLGRRVAHHRRQQHTPQCIAEGVTVAALEGLESGFRAMAAKRLDLDGLGLQKSGLHEVP